MDDGRVYFNPILRNLTTKKVLADIPVRDKRTALQLFDYHRRGQPQIRLLVLVADGNDAGVQRTPT